MNTGKLAVLLFFFTAMVVPALPADAATPLACGSIVTGNVVLTRDLNCAGTALTVERATPGAVTINLNGHSVRGNGTGDGIDVPDDPVVAKVTSLTVSGGTIADFDVAIGPDERRDGVAWPFILTISHARILSSNLWVGLSYRTTTIDRSTIVDAGSAGAVGEATFTVENSLLVNSSVSSFDESWSNLYNNTFVHGGFTQGEAANTVATGNTFSYCDTGMDVEDVWPWGRSAIENNQFIGCRVGLALTVLDGTIPVENNVFSNNTGDGFRFTTAADGHATIAGNQFLDNHGDGLYGRGAAGITVASNRAVGNTGHGIYTPGVTDGKHNVAANNGTKPDCFGVLCAPAVAVAP